MKSLFAKNFFMYAMIVVFSFAILGSAFIYQVNRFSAEEKENQLSETAARAAQNTLTFLNSQKVSGWRSEFSSNYLVSMRQLAADCGGMIFVGDGDGDLLFVATDEGCYTQENGVIPKLAADALLRSGTYTDQSNFYGFLSAPCYIRGITVTNGTVVEGMVFVAFQTAVPPICFSICPGPLSL